MLHLILTVILRLLTGPTRAVTDTAWWWLRCRIWLLLQRPIPLAAGSPTKIDLLLAVPCSPIVLYGIPCIAGYIAIQSSFETLLPLPLHLFLSLGFFQGFSSTWSD